MAKAEQPEKSTDVTFQHQELTMQDKVAHILTYWVVGTLVSVSAVAVATHGEYNNAIPVLEASGSVSGAGSAMPNFDVKIPRRQTPGVSYLLSTDPKEKRKGKVLEGVQYAGYGTEPREDMFLLDTGAKITRKGDDIEVLALYGPDQPVQLPLDAIARGPASIAFQDHVLFVGTSPTDVHDVIDYMVPRNTYPIPGMFKQSG